jgi:beta-1,4-mannosyl-glycoprotein beta-1,4-N-acetylglucosaminyltransferase
MIYDCFTFFNELDLLDIRLNTLNKYVEKFIIVEAGKTQSLIDKPFYFEENKHRFSKFADKIIHIKVEDYPDNKNNLWEMENHQRNCIRRGFSNISDSDIVIISDLDEVPNPKKFDIFNDPNFRMASFEQDFYAYFLNLKSINSNWIGSVAIKYSLLKNISPQNVRNHKDNIPTRIADGGWHFSWLGGAEAAWKKSRSCIEPLDKSELPSREDFIKFFDQYRKLNNHFFIKTENLTSDGKTLNKIKLDNTTHPAYIVENIEKFKEFIL